MNADENQDEASNKCALTKRPRSEEFENAVKRFLAGDESDKNLNAVITSGLPFVSPNPSAKTHGENKDQDNTRCARPQEFGTAIKRLLAGDESDNNIDAVLTEWGLADSSLTFEFFWDNQTHPRLLTASSDKYLPPFVIRATSLSDVNTRHSFCVLANAVKRRTYALLEITRVQTVNLEDVVVEERKWTSEQRELRLFLDALMINVTLYSKVEHPCVCDALLALWKQRVQNAEPCHGIRTVVIIGGRHHAK
jgi:hypothetical protein